MRRIMMPWLLGAGVALLSGCASQATEQTAAERFDCTALNQAITSAETGFEDIKGRLETTDLTRTWQTDTQAFHDACVITSARRPDHYLCFGPLATDDPRGALVAGGEALGQCLGESWQSERTAPDRLAFTRQGREPVVVLESFLNDRGRRMGTLGVYQNAADAAPRPGEE
ncbi:hypothetical protein CVH10_13780 [Halomonas sp. ND22Bw]|uniref:Lipoprotein n=2 Tax=Halomonas TaxID=2745 RepID=A0ABR4WUU9_9GAMM|nr:hypothetical protein [Halomonas salina]KGE78513.1 hypothetical protein FP66_02975 [Halomonas salina]PSJ21189.1 hypothetical protein CVH10_13780 [Halomonas sp. ND22Bw]